MTPPAPAEPYPSNTLTPTAPQRPRTLVLGCGWLGLPLAHSLLANGCQVAGTTTSPEQLDALRADGIDAHLLRLGPDFTSADEARLLSLLRRTDVLVLNVPPRAAACAEPGARSRGSATARARAMMMDRDMRPPFTAS